MIVKGCHRLAQEQRLGTSTGKFLLIWLMSDEEPWNHYHSSSRNTELNVSCFYHGAVILYYKSMFSYYLHLKGSPQKLAFYTLIFTWRFIYNIIPVTALKRFSLHAFFYKQHFYKQRQAKIGKKKIKQMLSNTLRAKFCYLKIIHILHPHYHLKIIKHILKIRKITCISIFLR